MKLPLLVWILLLICIIPLNFLIQSREFLDAVENMVQFTGLVFAAVYFLRARLNQINSLVGKASLLICFGFSFWAFGQLLVLYSETLLHQISTGSISSIYFIIGYLLFLGGLYMLTKSSLAEIDPTNRQYARRSALLSIVSILIIATFVLKIIVHPPDDTASVFLNTTYAIFDLIVIGDTFFLFLISLRSSHVKDRRRYGLLFAGFVSIGISNFIGLYAKFGTDLYHLLDVLYFSSYFLMAMSGSLFVSRRSE